MSAVNIIDGCKSRTPEAFSDSELNEFQQFLSGTLDLMSGKLPENIELVAYKLGTEAAYQPLRPEINLILKDLLRTELNRKDWAIENESPKNRAYLFAARLINNLMIEGALKYMSGTDKTRTFNEDLQTNGEFDAKIDKAFYKIMLFCYNDPKKTIYSAIRNIITHSVSTHLRHTSDKTLQLKQKERATRLQAGGDPEAAGEKAEIINSLYQAISQLPDNQKLAIRIQQLYDSTRLQSGQEGAEDPAISRIVRNSRGQPLRGLGNNYPPLGTFLRGLQKGQEALRHDPPLRDALGIEEPQSHADRALTQKRGGNHPHSKAMVARG